MAEIYEDPDMFAHDPDYHREQDERPTTFQLTRGYRSRMRVVAHKEGFKTMIAWFVHQIEEAEKRVENK